MYSQSGVVKVVHMPGCLIAPTLALSLISLCKLMNMVINEMLHCIQAHIGLCMAQLGLEAPALAWLEALAFSNLRPGQSRHSQLGSGLAWPRPQLLYVNNNSNNDNIYILLFYAYRLKISHIS